MYRAGHDTLATKLLMMHRASSINLGGENQASLPDWITDESKVVGMRSRRGILQSVESKHDKLVLNLEEVETLNGEGISLQSMLGGITHTPR